MPTRLAALFALLNLATPATPAPAADAAPAFPPEQIAFYEKQVKPILQRHCLKCHGDDPKKIKGGFALTARTAVLQGGDTGPAVDLAKPGESLLLKAVHYKDETYQMPPAGKLADAEIATLEKWVRDGLPFPPGAADHAPATAAHGPVQPDPNYWAYRPVARPPVPAVQNAAWVKSPTDAFLLAKLEAAGLSPNGPAPRAALVRRAYYDLTGLAPTPEQIDAFVADARPDAFARLVDELLASPHYGEKWGRHWLDVVRYAETNGYERDGPKPFAWRYRDYVVRSFNADKPFDRFVREQIAGDELFPGDPDAIVATGFYRLGLWDDEPADKEQALYDGYDDLVTVAGQGFLGMTLNCCRCHDHKGDGFPQTDYYKMVAFFRDVRPLSDTRDPRSSNSLTDISPPERRAKYEAELRTRQAKMDALRAKMKPAEDAAILQMEPKDQLAVQDGKRAEIVRKVPEFLPSAERKAYLALREQLRALEKQPNPNQELALSVNNGDANPPTTHVLIRGNVGANGKAVVPGFPTVFQLPDPKIAPPAKGAKSSNRRSALAEFVASPANPLTARVFVNRVWQHHFGRGIVASSNDFGKLGELPTHPELLDYLAGEFIAGGWSVKQLHRALMLSSAYQMSSAANPAAAKDPDNRLWWRNPMRRLQAEEVRDGILQASGELRRDLYGPSVYPKIPREVLAGQSRPGEGWLLGMGGGFDPKDPDAGNRRSVYAHVKRSLQVPVLIAHDQADTDNSCPVRYTTTVPTQALGMLNGEFAQEQAAALARRLERECPGDLAAQVARGVRLTAGRTPADAEVSRDCGFVRELRAKYGLDESAALARYALLLLNANEFVYLD